MSAERAASVDTVSAAIAVERGRIGAKINRARIAAVFGWCVLGMIFGLLGRPEWLVPLPALGVGLAIAIALDIAERATHKIAVHLWLATPLLDLPMVSVVQSHFLEVSVRPQAVAIFTIAILCSLVFVSQLSFNRTAILITLLGALVSAAWLLDKAQLPLPNLFAATLLLGWAATVAAFSSARTQELVVSIVRQRMNRETELTALVAERTASLAAAQSDLVRAEKLASVATLVKGIAHELNNPLNFVVNNVEPLERYVKYISDVAGQLAKEHAGSSALALRFDGKRDFAFVTSDLESVAVDIAEGARRARLIVGDLQALTSVTTRGFEEIDLALVARQTKSLFETRLTDGLTIELNLRENVMVRARAGQLEQVLVNLVDNAIRASKPKGRIVIGVARDERSATITVRDEGHGMTDEQRKHALEPFFTTRAAGEGSGLGLAIVAQIVEAHEGSIAIESRLEQGTEVRVGIPITTRAT
jgi:signal transduction histidine kinase